MMNFVFGGSSVIYNAGFEIVEGYVDDIVTPEKLPPEINNESPVDAQRAWDELQRSCKGL